MTIEHKTAIDNKITELGREGCKKFLMETGAYTYISGLFRKDYRRAVRSELAAENWDDYTQLFLDYNPNAV